MFNKHASEFGLKPIMLAAFAMQESTCNPATVGGGGEQGLMQLTEDKCGAAPGGDCRDPVSLSCCYSSRLAFGALAHDIGVFFSVQDYNIRTGAKYFADTLSGNGGSVLVSIGEYNGWAPGLTQVRVICNPSAHTVGFQFDTITEMRRRKKRPQPGTRRAAGARTTWTSASLSFPSPSKLYSLTISRSLFSLHQYMNGWLQNIDAYAANLGKYHNLDGCADK
jgi:hypothetical protein